MRIAIAGNPNSGKTTLFNALTGKTEYVGNWPGVTVEKKEAFLKKKYDGQSGIKVVDLPGAYSISPFTGEEVITSDYVRSAEVDVIINIVDGANLSRSLFFTSQLLELGIPVVVALNKSDVLTKRKEDIDLEKFKKILGCEVVLTTATENKGLDALIKAAKSAARQIVASKNEIEDDIKRQKQVDAWAKDIYITKKDTSQVTFSDKVDRIVAHKWLGIPIFFAVMYAVFSFSINGLGGYLSGFLNDVVFGDKVPGAVESLLSSWGVHSLLKDLIIEGVIGGVGAVLGFLPLIMILFFCLALLEDSGYMARIAVVMDRFFKKIGLSGKSIIPMIVGSGCAIPGVMATRTIEDINERRMTTILTPFVPCGAKLPIIALFAASFFKDQLWVGPSMYIIAITMIIIGGMILKRIFTWESTTSFIIELPEYKMPSLKHGFMQMMDKGKAFIVKATTIILVCNTLVWFAQAYSFGLKPVEDSSLSILAGVGNLMVPILIPLGFVGWQMGAAILTGFIAKENVVSTFGVILLASEATLHSAGGPLAELFTPITAFSFLVFNLFTPPCFAAIGAMNSELGSKKWLFKALAFQLGIGYTLSLMITQFGSILINKEILSSFLPSMMILAGIFSLTAYLMVRNSKANNIEKQVA